MFRNLTKKHKIVSVFIVFLSLLLIAVLVGSFLFFKKPKQYNKEAFVNAKIYTVDSKNPWAESMVIEKDKIIFVGSGEEAKRFIDKDTKIHDVGGKLILPGFIDSHNHIALASGQTGLKNSVFLDYNWNKDTILKELKGFVKKNKNLDIIFGFGFNSNAFGPNGPTAKELDEIESNKPMLIIDEGGHSAWENSKAMEIGNINKNTPDPVPKINYYQRDNEGNPTGWLKETETFVPLIKKLNIITNETVINGAKKLFPIVSQYGITTAYDAGMLGFEDIIFPALMKIESQNNLPFRISGSYMVRTPKSVPTAVDSLKELNSKFSSDLIRVNTMKILYDGTIEANTAAMFQGYGENNKENGHVLFDVYTLKKIISDTSDADFNIHIHSIGDKALDNITTAFEYLEKTNYNPGIRKTIAHVQFFNDDSVERISALKEVVIQTTPGWFGPSPDNLAKVGEARYKKQWL